MAKLIPWGLFALIIGLTQPALAAQPEISLSNVAARAHLNYNWLAAERAVSLTGPGIVIVIRPGESLYEVNDRVESASIVPRYAANDIYVSRMLGAHIVQLAARAESQVSAAQNPGGSYQAPASSGPAITGTIALNVAQLTGAEAVLVTGQAPPQAPVRITLLATVSSELPTILVSRHDLQPDAGGHFQAVIPIGADYLRASILKVLATSLPGITSASAQVLIVPPNGGISVPAELQPSGIW